MLKLSPMQHRDTNWNKVAKWYDGLVGEKGSDFHQSIIFPRVLDILKNKKAKRVLDVACGQGAFCRQLVKEGFSATGVDAGENLIRLARQRNPQAEYLVAPADKMDKLKPLSFDAAVCILAIQNIDPIEPVFQEMKRILKPNGSFILVMNHPCFRIPRQSGWGIDEKRKLQYRRIDSYLSPQKIPIRMHPGADPKTMTISFHRPLEEYFRALAGAGFCVENLEEWSSHRQSLMGKTKRMEDRARDEIPLFLMMGAK